MKKTVRILLITLVMLITYGLFSSVKAASASLGASATNVSVGDKVTISVNVNAAAWEIHVSGAVSGSYADVSSDANNTSFTKTLTFTPSSEGSYTVNMTGNVTDQSSDKPKDVSGKITINASAKSSDGNKTDNEKKNEAPTFKSVNETMYANGDINVRKSYSTDSDRIGSLKKGDKVTRTGIGSNGWSKVSYDGGTGYIYTSLLTDKEPKKSEDKALKSLSIEGAELNPAFDPEITDYAVTFTEGDKLDIKAEANDEKAKVEITGNEELKDGDNTIKITVTAEDGTTRIYTIIATKGDAKEGMLKSLKVSGYTLSPAFSSSVKEYKITILDANVNSIDVTAESSDEKAKVEISGNTGLKNGENTILIKVSSEDGTKTDTYKIIATKNASSTAVGNTNEKKTDKSNLILYGGIGIIALLILAIVVVIIISRRNAYYDEDEEYDDEEEENGEDKEQEDYSDLYGYSTKSEVKNSEPAVDENAEKEKFINESIYGDFSAKANNERAAEEEKTKYEDGFNYNATNSKDMYETPSDNGSEYTKLPDYDNFHAPADDVKGEASGVKDVDYYSNKVSEMFDQTGDETSKPAEDNSVDANNYPTTDWDDDYKPRRSKGKHAK